MSVEQKEFRNALGQFATGVAIVTATVDGNRLGATISSFNSVSLEPLFERERFSMITVFPERSTFLELASSFGENVSNLLEDTSR